MDKPAEIWSTFASQKKDILKNWEYLYTWDENYSISKVLSNDIYSKMTQWRLKILWQNQFIVWKYVLAESVQHRWDSIIQTSINFFGFPTQFVKMMFR